jgi:Cu/Ag efflux protein CusF
VRDRRWLLLILGSGAIACRSKPPAAIKRYRLLGEVVRIDRPRKIVTVKHGKIEGWMDAMTMDFPVHDPAELANLAEGKPVRATVFVRDLDFWLGDIQTQ